MLDHSIFSHITTFIFDVDGVLTDGQILVTEEGELLRKMNVRDGQAIKIALQAGYKIFITTKGSSKGVRKRLELLGVTKIYDKLSEKISAFQEIKEEFNLEKSTMLYVGDDLPDLALVDEVSVFACPYDAVNDVLRRADYISYYKGGKGCVREIIERVLRIQGKWIID